MAVEELTSDPSGTTLRAALGLIPRGRRSSLPAVTLLRRGNLATQARAALAMDVMCQGAKKLIGAYVAEMNGVDVLVFTAGLGENDARAREKIASDLEFLGIRLDKEKNRNMERGVNAVISTDDSPVKVLVIPTDEEYMIAADTMKLVGDR